MTRLYHNSQSKLHTDNGEFVILKKWRDNCGELQYDAVPLPPVPPPALSPGTIRIYSNMVKLSVSELQPKHLHGVLRGQVIPEFSGKKRKRMLDAVNSWRIPLKCAFFVTLSYPRDYPQTWKEWKHDFKIYKEHLQRRFPNVVGFWKLELQRRGAPHYHLVFDTIEEISLREFRDWNDELWANIAHYLDSHAGIYACTVKKLHTLREALNYAAKYQTKKTCAPMDANGQEQTSAQLGDSMGRLWGRIGKPDCAPSEQISVRREWALNSKHEFANILHKAGQHKYADYLERQGAHNSLTLYSVGDTPQTDDKRGKSALPSISADIHSLLRVQRAYIAYKRPKGYKPVTPPRP